MKGQAVVHSGDTPINKQPFKGYFVSIVHVSTTGAETLQSCVFISVLSPLCEEALWKIEPDHTGLGLKSASKGQTTAYLLCRPFERCMAAALVWILSLCAQIHNKKITLPVLMCPFIYDWFLEMLSWPYQKDGRFIFVGSFVLIHIEFSETISVLLRSHRCTVL